MKKIIGALLFLGAGMTVFAQQGKDGAGVINAAGTIVNSYTTLSADAAASATTITVTSSASLSAGDLIMIIQMQTFGTHAFGSSLSVIAANGGFVGPFYDTQSSEPTDTSYGRVHNYNGAGNNELAEISSISGTTLTLNCGLKNAYFVAGKTQIVRVPRYTSLTINAAGAITCPHWDRTLGYGGVIAVEVHGNTTIASGGSINASYLGFRGGATWNKTSAAPGTTRWGALYRDAGGNKGEGIAGDTTEYANWSAKFCKGSLANGGGGGNAVNAGGGGGSNAGLLGNYRGGIGNIDTTTVTNYINAWSFETANMVSWRAFTNSGGGRGGYTWSNSTSNPLTTGPNNTAWNGGGNGDSRRVEGGLGGRPLDYSNGQMYLGGGGGAGDHENNYGGAGGDGGGIIYIMSYGTISGAGAIIANGENGDSTAVTGAFNNVAGRDGAGGGGGGGAIYISSTGAVSGVSVSARGGKGGNQRNQNNMFTSTNMAYGPGGGGGGGFINVPAGTTATTNVTAGNNGIMQYTGGTNGTLIDNNFPPNGATKGGPGIASATTTSFSITTTGATICSGASAVLTASLTGTAPNPVTINWYTAAVGGTPIATGTSYTTATLTNTTTYYVGTCPGIFREPVVVTVTSALAAPTATSPVSYCLNAAASQLTATAGSGNTLLWWGTDAAGGTSSATAPTPSTASAGSVTYYVSQASGSCESPRQPIVVNVLNLPAQPGVTSPVDYCAGATASALSATSAGGTLLWWGTDASGGASTTVATIPSTAATGTTTYYVSESNGTCESARAPIVVNVNALPAPPVVADTVSYCQNEASTPLTPSGAGINWYAVATNGSPIATPTPNTATVGTTTYYVSQVQSGCESARDSVKVVVNTSYLPPSVTNVSYCLGETAADLSANASGTGTLNWWGTDAIGGTSSATAPTPSTATAGTISYYVSQGSATCESNRAQIDVVVNAIPNEPAGTNVTYCVGDVAAPLTATSDPGNTLLWYTASTGGTGSTAAPVPSTATAGSSFYFVAQTNGSCESTRDNITVIVNPLPSPPLVADTASYCQNETATPLQPVASNINWYTAPTGGTAVPSITPNTSTAGVSTYYVTIIISGCESLRDSVKVSINTQFAAPAVTDTSYCQGAAPAMLFFNVSGVTTLNWYSASTGGTSTPLPPTPSTAVPGSTFYYVSQGAAACESGRSEIEVVINPLPSSPTATDVSYCLNESAVALSATGSGTLNWYTVSTGGTAAATAPTPNTTSTGTVNYYVSQTDANGCEGGRDTLTVSVINLQTPPAVSNVDYCIGATPAILTANGTSTLNWWGTNAAGGTPSATAPTPSTIAAGTTTYFVSQGTGACESPRAPIAVTVHALPTISFTQNATTGCTPACITFTPNTSLNNSLLWNMGDGTTTTTAIPVQCYDSAGVYNVSVVATDPQGCTNSSSVTAAVTIFAGVNAQFGVLPGTTVIPGTPVTFAANTVTGVNYNWNFADPSSGALNTSTLTSPEHTFNELGIYCVQLTASASSCSDVEQICIEVINGATVEIPNIFTPNGDDVNEQFLITSSGLKTLEGSIYDRWGVKLYSWNGTSGGWDGKGKSGKVVSNGVYFYVITATDFMNEAKEYTGHVQVIGVE